MRIKAVLAYDGSRFNGFQIQNHTKNTVMYTITKALHNLGVESKVVGSGRTDSGVHATAQVIHFDLPPYWQDLQKFATAFDKNLAPYVRLRNIERVSENFHARYSAKRRAYRYLISRKPLSPFMAAYAFHANYDKNLVDEALKLFIGRHDFVYFMKTGSDTKSSVRTLFKAKRYEYRDFDVLYFEGDGFLRGQIRLIVDALLKMGQKRMTLSQLQAQIEAKERSSTTLAPPNGLYLCRIIY
ncbi:tRNA pseudouridine(38-40) synthase TruA [Nitratiruptor sp. YY09-18]|uniref:tRNA pseudouridine(38-40) synthase TruA n=1 Tax=Nitratiruptor sp. YY09-18 TaxID=2724901 RepID=UPI001916688D|nr:tRNA pseudouridine(38-40) synthase TruA [Nitratiruptor sp. YY09-18]BCD67897.1 tRNA pseudouridine38-40 synthase [Nitratiruptor sp. YY09-18]